MKERTFAIIKPDAVAAGNTSAILDMIRESGLEVVFGRHEAFDKETAEEFYAEHKGKPFFEPLVEFMTSGTSYVAILEGEDAIASYRKLMGATNPADRQPGTIRYLFGDKEITRRNAVHGSDSPAAAEREISFIFCEHMAKPTKDKRPRP